MIPEAKLPGKWTFRAHGSQVVFVRKLHEKSSHVLMKALLWALYLPVYPDLAVEFPVGDRYRPDLVALDAKGHPAFWGEAGHFRAGKICSLVNRYRNTHFALAKWGSPLGPFVSMVAKPAAAVRRTRPVDLLKFPRDSSDRFLDDSGVITVTLDDIEWIRLG